jgi:hypothetical protein
MPAIDWDRFASVFNDLEKHPSLADVCVELGITYQTVRNRSAILRAMNRKGKGPTILNRQEEQNKARAVTKNKGTPKQHADRRAETLSSEITTLLTKSQYPVINPESVIVESSMIHVWDREVWARVQKESTPRTWLSDTLRVNPIEDCKGRRFIFTGAQNDTEVHEGFWINLQAYAADIGAEIVVGPWTYETQWWAENNPTSRSYDPLLEDYLCFGQMKIGKNFVFCGEMNTLPTASRPISDLVTYSRGRWAVFPHAKRQLKSVPSTDPSIQAHQVMTTGSCTRPKIIPRKAGVKSIFHHVIGAVVVEFDQDGDIFCRHISANQDGDFYDLDAFVKKAKVTRGHRARAITFGDVHRAKLTPKNAGATFGIDIDTGAPIKGSLLDLLKPKDIFIHDVFDNYARNHHNQKDNAHFYEVAHRGKENVLDELKDAARFLGFICRRGMTVWVVDSNHDLALEKYVREGRYRLDGKNIRLGLQLEDAYMEYRERVGDALNAYKPTPSFSLLEYAVRKIDSGLRNVKWVIDGKSFVIDGVECGHHGFRGANGAKGSVAGFSRIGKKMSIGDKHSPEIMDGVYVAGTMELQHGYNKGPSGWAVSHIVQYPDGKRALVTMQNGKIRG